MSSARVICQLSAKMISASSLPGHMIFVASRPVYDKEHKALCSGPASMEPVVVLEFGVLTDKRHSFEC